RPPPRCPLFPYTTLFRSLAVDLDQGRGQGAKLGQGRGTAVDPGARTAVRAQGAAQLAFVAVVELGLAQPFQGCGGIAQVEFGGQDRKSTRLNSSHVKISY